MLIFIGTIWLTFCGYTAYREFTKKKRTAIEKEEGMHR